MIGTLKDNLLLYLVLLNVLLGLLSLDIFVHQGLFSFYAFVLTSIVLGIFTSVMLIRNNHKLIQILPAGFIFFFLFVAYVFFNSLINKQSISYHHTYWFSCLILYYSIMILFPLLNSNRAKVLRSGLVIICVLESVYCILQYFKIFKSENLFFEVTGTLENPNVTAMFLAMCFPIIFVPFIFNNGRTKILNILMVTLTVLALMLLKCRSAFIAVGISSLMLLNYKYNIILILKKGLHRYAIVATGIVVIVTSAYLLYKSKQISADNRIKIWKNSMFMVEEKPWIGYGYGFFERSYNLRKIKYNTPNSNFLEAAGAVRMAYNEIIQHLVEGGVVGFLLFSFFLLFVVRSGFNSLAIIDENRDSKEYNEPKEKEMMLIAFSGIISFLVLSLTNFTYQAIPVMGLFVLYCGIISSNSHQLTKNLVNRKLTQIYSMIFCICYICIFISQIQVARSEIYNKRGRNLIKEGRIKEAIACLKPLESILSTHNLYWKNYGTALVLDGQYKQAVRVIDEELKFSVDADVHLKKGFCYEKTNEASLAFIEYKNASYIDHHKMKPHFYLMRLYLNQKKMKDAVIEAQKILAVVSDNSSKESVLCRRAAINILHMVK